MRKVKSADNLVADVEGDIEEVDGVLKITNIRLRYRFRIPSDLREQAQRAVDTHAEKCPAYQSVKGCIHCCWEAMMEEET